MSDFDEAPCGYIVTEPMGRFLRANEMFCRWVQYSADDLIGSGKTLQDLLTSAGRLYFEYTVAPSLHGAGFAFGVGLELQPKDGRSIPLLMDAREGRDVHGQPQSIRATFTHIGDRRRYERDLELAKSRAEDARKRVHLLAEVSAILAQVLRNSHALQNVATLLAHQFVDGCAVDLWVFGEIVRVAVCHRRGHFMGVMRHLKPPAVRVTQPLLLSHPGDLVQGAGVAMRAYSEELKAVHPQSIILAPLFEKRRPKGTLVLLTEYGGQPLSSTDMELSQELAQRISVSLDNMRLFRDNLHAIKTRDDFMSICSHELSTPLQALKLKGEMARRRIQRLSTLDSVSQIPTHDVLNFLDAMELQVRRLSRLVHDMLDLAQLRNGAILLKRGPVDLVQIARQVLRTSKDMLEGAHCPVTFRDDGPLIGRWDASRLEQVLLNLLTNAIKYGANAPIHITCRHRGNHAVLHIRDHGRGIAREDQERIFQRFERSVSRSEVSGLGLGLYISRKIIQSHGGSIRIRSKMGAGTVFILSLPSGMRVKAHRTAQRWPDATSATPSRC